eukprot:3816299-Pyramimonas_sp.AAC.1
MAELHGRMYLFSIAGQFRKLEKERSTLDEWKVAVVEPLRPSKRPVGRVDWQLVCFLRDKMLCDSAVWCVPRVQFDLASNDGAPLPRRD